SGAYLKASADVANKTADVKLADITFLPVIPKPEKIVCAVRNYMDHHQEVLAAGMQRELSEEPPIFLRVWRSQVAHGQPIVCPKVSASLDWEGELAVIIGKEGRNIAEADAFDHVAGYSCYNDGSIREWQFHAKQIASGKNFESTGGFGPWMVTADEIKPNQELKLVTRLNGVVEQSSHTGHMIFPIAKLISYASNAFAKSLTGTACRLFEYISRVGPKPCNLKRLQSQRPTLVRCESGPWPLVLGVQMF
ncbi:MAG: FAA hydrolase family protein, partial [Betaproteobacteria bacterium]|nr:FAA hydrolase family protein [Betaproteobacteria bacterium]